VIGILIALQLNHLNETRKEHLKEKIFLKEINKEFLGNRSQLDTVLQYHEQVMSNCEKAISLMPISLKSDILDSLSIYLNLTFARYTFNPSQGSINSLISTSSFDIIQNDTLRHLLISWKDIVEDYQEEEVLSQNFVLNYYEPFFNENFEYDLKLTNSRTDLNILQTLIFENIIRNRYDRIQDILNNDELENLRSAIDQIIEFTKSKD